MKHYSGIINTTWRLITYNGFEYAVCAGQRYKCTTAEIYKRNIAKFENKAVLAWRWVPKIERYVNCVSSGMFR